jgi:acetyl-CoA acetyltransferase
LPRSTGRSAPSSAPWKPNEDPLTGPAWAAARHLWKHADFTPHDVDVAQIYDAFTPLVPLSLEGYGFCGRGEGGAFTEGGALETGGRLPLNTGGAASARPTSTGST